MFIMLIKNSLGQNKKLLYWSNPPYPKIRPYPRLFKKKKKSRQMVREKKKKKKKERKKEERKIINITAARNLSRGLLLLHQHDHWWTKTRCAETREREVWDGAPCLWPMFSRGKRNSKMQTAWKIETGTAIKSLHDGSLAMNGWVCCICSLT